MREILFRGKRKDNGEWLYWDCFGRLTGKDGKIFNFIKLVEDGGKAYWEIVNLVPILLYETVGQYTGLEDKNGKKIFEDDILKIKCVCSDPKYTEFVEQVIFTKGKFCVTIAGWNDFERTNPNMCEVIGNIFDNPELLEG